MGIRKLKQKVAVALVAAMSVMNVLTPLAGVGNPSTSTRSITVTFNAGNGGSFDLEQLASSSNATGTNTSKDSSSKTQLVRVFTDLGRTDKDNYPYTSLEVGGQEKGETYDESVLISDDKDAHFYGWYCDGTLVEQTTDIFSDVTLEARWYEVKGTMSSEEQKELAVEANLPAGDKLVLNTLEKEKVTTELAKEENKKALDAKLEEENITIPADKPMYTLDISVEGTSKKVDVTMNVPDVFAEEDFGNLRVVHFTDDYSAVKEILKPTIKDGRMTFTMTGFSPVAIVVTEEKPSGKVDVTIDNVKNGYILAWTEAQNEETKKYEKTYLPLGEAVALEAGTTLYLQPYGYGQADDYSEGWTGRLDALEVVNKDGKVLETLKPEEHTYPSYINYDRVEYAVKENCTIQAEFSRWAPEPKEDSEDNTNPRPEFDVSLNTYRTMGNRYSGRISVRKWDAEAKRYKEISDYQIRIATEKEVSDNDKFPEYQVERLKKGISSFNYENKVLYSKGTLEEDYYEIPFVITYEDKEYFLRTENSPYSVGISKGDENETYFGLYLALVRYNEKYDNGTSYGTSSLFTDYISVTQNMNWESVREPLLNGLEEQYYGAPKMYNYPILSWQDENGNELKDSDAVGADNHYFYSLFKKADGTAYHVDAKYDEGPLTDDEYTITIKNVDNGVIIAYTEIGDEEIYIPLEEKVTLPAGTRVTLYAQGYGRLDGDAEWEGKLTSLKLISEKEEKNIANDEDNYYRIKLDKNYTVEAAFTKVVETQWKRSKFNFYTDRATVAGKYSSKVELGVLTEENGREYQKLDPSEYKLRIATEEDFFKAGVSSERYDGDLFTYENGVLNSKGELALDSYEVPFVITYQDQDWLYNEASDNTVYSEVISIGATNSFYHGVVKQGDQYETDNGSDYIGQVRFEKDGNENWGTVEALLDSSKVPQMYGYKFAGWQNYKGEAYKADSALASENENANHYYAFDMFVKADDESKPYEAPKATIDDKQPVEPDKPEDPNNPENPGNNGGNNGGNGGSSGGSGGGGSRRHVVGGGSSTNSYSMTGNWVMGENGWTFVKSDGQKAANTWGWINGQYYYFDAQGNMATGWQFINGQWYYLNPAEGSLQGAMIVGVIYDPVYNAYFYANASGAMVTGWYQVGANWYYFSPVNDGVHVQGALLSGTYVDGYYLGADGAWIPSN